MNKLLMVSGDSHIGARPEDYREYLDPAFRGAMDDLLREDEGFLKLAPIIHPEPDPETLEVIDPQHVLRSGGLTGAWDVGRRLAEMDREGVTAEVLHHGHQLAIQPFFSVVNNPHPPELRAAGMRAYHRWAVDCIAEADGRLGMIADPGPCLDLKATIAELHWAKAHGFITPSSIRTCEVAMRYEIGLPNLIFGTDYPHAESTWPNTHDWIRTAFEGVPEQEARLILGENAIRCYGLDRAKLAALACRIGPRPEDVLGGPYKLDPLLLAHFDQRGGLRHPPEEVHAGPIDAALDQDVRGLAEVR